VLLRTTAAPIFAVAAALALTGCYPEIALNKGSFTASVDQQKTKDGTSTFEPPGRTVKGSVWKGTFTAKLTGQAAKAAKLLGLKLTGGSFVAQLDGQEDYSIGKATGHALQLVTFKDKKTGSVCAQVDYSSTDHGKTYTGTWKALGGTGKLAKVKASGTLQSTPATQAQPGPAAMTGKGSAGTIRKAVGLSAACKALKTL
jgi:hypothetical protein